MRKAQASHLLFVCVLGLGLSYSNPSLANSFNPVRQVIKRTLELVIEKAMGAGGMFRLNWEKEIRMIVPRMVDDVDAAGQPLSRLTASQIQRINRYLSTPEIAEIIITDEMMLGRPALVSELRAGWRKTLTLFKEAAVERGSLNLKDSKGVYSYTGDLNTLVKSEETFAFLERFFYDEISQLAERIENRLLHLAAPNDVAFNKSLRALKRLFHAKPLPMNGNATLELEAYVRGLLTQVSEKMESLQKWMPAEKRWVAQTIDQGESLELFKTKLAGAGKYFDDLKRYLADLDALQWLLKKYDVFLKADRRLNLMAEEGIPMMDDYLRAILRYAQDDELRYSAIRMILQKNSLGEALFSRAVLRDLLAGADQSYRKTVLEQIKAGMKLRRRGLRPDVDGLLETLLEESCRFMRGDPKFDETIEMMIVLVRYPTETAMAEALANPAVSAAHQRGVIQALGRMDTPEAFEVLLKSYFEESFKNNLADKNLLEALMNVWVNTLEGNLEKSVILARQDKLSGLLHAIAAHEREPEIWRKSIWALGELYWQESHPETIELFKTLLAGDTPLEIQVEALLALSKMKLPEEIKAFMGSFLQEGIRPELRAAAAIGLPSHHANHILLSSLSLAPSEISDRLLIAILEEFHQSGIKTAFELDQLRKAVATLLEKRSPLEIQIHALSVLSSRQDAEAALTLLNELFDRATLTQKGRIVEMVLMDHTSTEVLKRAFDRVFEMYRVKNAEFDILNMVSPAFIKKRFLHLIEYAPADAAVTELLDNVKYTSGEFRDFLRAALVARSR